ncbi:hydroxymethylbilane synthase [Faecalicatena contorta]|uniref:Porphobilinogen deaminase n=1 Tax=Faecalicatena contorta TaxID=39482 RepID=A0A316A5V5_9FIRM|nr:hydroxymethylbilane synthase [Faecalicatena contorta]PWJ52164.1 hydroxymethylbilane synthase [Faecalicatena contorta]SUQ12442.1 hydroxymethylbilane synthase [Faecalicatena contorta]
MKSVIRIGSRESRLAVIQAEIVKKRIQKYHPEIQVELVTMKTTGDRILDKSLELIGGKGLFVKELDQALIEGRIDLSVHSLKDMPMEIPEDLPILAFTEREDPRDALIYRPGLCEIPDRGVIGTSSRRRMLQMKKLYPSCTFRGIRGNVQTRLRKLTEEGYDGTVLAAAGLKRLEMESVIGRIFEVEEIVPAAGQGILAVQGRKGENHSYLECVQDKKSEAEALAEREFVAALDGGCSSPVAAHARVLGGEVKLTGLYYREEDDTYLTAVRIGEVQKARQLGAELAEIMKYSCN